VSLKAAIGLDRFDLLVHLGITALLAVVAASAATGGRDEVPIAIIFAASLGLLAWRRSRFLRSQPPITTGEVQAERVFLLEDRVAELEAQQARLQELEERLDFAERLLAQKREAPRLVARDPE
jgi:hypothetical protein